jgi:hypothetical protein
MMMIFAVVSWWFREVEVMNVLVMEVRDEDWRLKVVVESCYGG